MKAWKRKTDQVDRKESVIEVRVERKSTGLDDDTAMTSSPMSLVFCWKRFLGVGLIRSWGQKKYSGWSLSSLDYRGYCQQLLLLSSLTCAVVMMVVMVVVATHGDLTSPPYHSSSSSSMVFMSVGKRSKTKGSYNKKKKLYSYATLPSIWCLNRTMQNEQIQAFRQTEHQKHRTQLMYKWISVHPASYIAHSKSQKIKGGERTKTKQNTLEKPPTTKKE